MIEGPDALSAWSAFEVAAALLSFLVVLGVVIKAAGTRYK